jgi:hypothetical protein
VFNFSSASHSLLSVFRALSGAHGAAIAAKSKEAVAEQVALLLPQAQALGAVCVPSLPPEVREPYAKQVLVVQGLVALTSAVARNVTAMLQQVRELSGQATVNSWLVMMYEMHRMVVLWLTAVAAKDSGVFVSAACRVRVRVLIQPATGAARYNQQCSF